MEAEVFDNPFVHIVVWNAIRKRLDTKSIIQLLHGLDAPPDLKIKEIVLKAMGEAISKSVAVVSRKGSLGYTISITDG